MVSASRDICLLSFLLGPFWLLAGHILNNLYINNWDLRNLYAPIKRKWQRKRKGYAPIECIFLSKKKRDQQERSPVVLY
jgi:hypothetical protein